MEEGEALGNQIGAAYVKRERMRDLKVISRVSFCWPQKVPARARRMLRREEARETMESIWGEKVKWGSKVTPRMRGFSDSGRS